MSTLTSAIDPRRRTEADPDYQRIQAQTEKRLHAALARLCSDLRTGRVQATAAQSVYIHTATSILEAAYTEAHAEGQRDYWQRVSQVPHAQPIVAPDEGKMRQRLAFYAPSVAKMAHEALLAHQAALAGRTLAEVLPERAGVIRLMGGHEAGYEQNRDAHGRGAPGDEGEGDRGEVKRLGPGYNPYRDSHGRFAPGPHAPRESETSGGNGRPGASRSEGRDTARHAGGGGRVSQRGGAPKTEEEKAAHPQARGTDAHGRDRSDEVVRQELLRRGYDGVIVKDWQSPARTQLVLGIAPETMRVIRPKARDATQE